MKKMKYVAPTVIAVCFATADVISSSVATVGEDGVIELRTYGFGGVDIGGLGE
jgi:hypothetical protein